MNQSEEDSSNWEDRVKRERVDESKKKQEHRIRKLERKTIQNVNLYFIFQAVILASSTTSACHHSWIPISLSLIAAITNFLTFFADVSKMLKSRERLDQEIVRPVDPIKKWKRRLVVYLSVALFAGFSAIVMYGCHTLLCHPGIESEFCWHLSQVNRITRKNSHQDGNIVKIQLTHIGFISTFHAGSKGRTANAYGRTKGGLWRNLTYSDFIDCNNLLHNAHLKLNFRFWSNKQRRNPSSRYYSL